MPLSKYNRHFGGKAAKAYRAMIRQYGAKKGRQVFYATVNKRRALRGQTSRGRRR